jgi:hypothetical protein
MPDKQFRHGCFSGNEIMDQDHLPWRNARSQESGAVHHSSGRLGLLPRNETAQASVLWSFFDMSSMEPVGSRVSVKGGSQRNG